MDTQDTNSKAMGDAEDKARTTGQRIEKEEAAGTRRHFCLPEGLVGVVDHE